MRKQTTRQNSDQKTLAPRLLSTSELQQAVGGVMKTRHETAKNVISNIR